MDSDSFLNPDLIDGLDGLYNYSEPYVEDDCCGSAGDVCSYDDEKQFHAVYIPVLYWVAFVVGVLGNGALLWVLARSRKTWSVTDNFILHLGVADVMLLMMLPFWAEQAAQDQGWYFGTPMCKITGAVFTLNFYCGIFLLACISLDRYLSIVHATQMYSRRKPWAVYLSCLSVWIFSILLSIPDWIFFEAVRNTRLNQTTCVRNYYKFGVDIKQWRLALRLIYHTVGFLLPSAILAFCYTCILRRLKCGSQGLQKQKAFKVIMAVVVVFFLCWTPYNIVLIVHTLNSDAGCHVEQSLQKAITVTSSLGNLHCILNPILYAFVGVKFRRQLLEVLKSLGCKLKTSTRLQSVGSRRSSMWSESSADTSNSIAV